MHGGLEEYGTYEGGAGDGLLDMEAMSTAASYTIGAVLGWVFIWLVIGLVLSFLGLQIGRMLVKRPDGSSVWKEESFDAKAVTRRF